MVDSSEEEEVDVEEFHAYVPFEAFRKCLGSNVELSFISLNLLKLELFGWKV